MPGPPGMSHPKDRSGLTRGQLLRGAAAAAAGVGVAGGLAACENTTEPIAVGCEPGPRTAAARRSSSRSRSGPAGSRCPRTDNSVTWAIVDDNPPIADDLPPETGATLQHLQLPGLHLPRATAPLRGALRLQGRAGGDVQLGRRGDRQAPVRASSSTTSSSGLSGSNIVNLMALQLLQPLNHTLPAEPRSEHLAGARRPVLRPRLALHRALCRLVGRDRLAKRQDHGGHPGAGRALGHLLGVRGSGRARSASSTTSATASRCRCSATR